MLLCRVTGCVVSTRKHDKLKGNRFLILETLTKPTTRLVAVDQLGAGIGEKVLVATGGAARIATSEDTPVCAAVVGIVDEE